MIIFYPWKSWWGWREPGRRRSSQDPDRCCGPGSRLTAERWRRDGPGRAPCSPEACHGPASRNMQAIFVYNLLSETVVYLQHRKKKIIHRHLMKFPGTFTFIGQSKYLSAILSSDWPRQWPRFFLLFITSVRWRRYRNRVVSLFEFYNEILCRLSRFWQFFICFSAQIHRYRFFLCFVSQEI